MQNPEIADVLRRIGRLLEIQGANPFKIRAYENAADTVRAHATPMAKLIDEGAELTDLPGVGRDMAEHIRELVATGRSRRLDELATKVPLGLLELFRLPGIGAKSVGKLWRELGVESLPQLEAAAAEGRVAGLRGFGEKKQRQILERIASLKSRTTRFLLADADRFVEPLLEHVRAAPGVERLDVAGSYRRRRETVGDIDLLAVAAEGKPVMEHFVGYDDVDEVRGAGDTRSTVILRSGLQVDLRIVPPESHGAAMVYFTGSKQHNIKLRGRAVRRGLRVSEYGVFRTDPEADDDRDPRAGERIAGRTEEEVYASVELSWIPPELREDRGEIAAAESDGLPDLIAIDDLRGDLQTHSTWSDGDDSIESMVEAAEQRGYEYVAITDHSKALAMTGGLDAARLREQWDEIEKVQQRHPDIRVLRGAEVEILGDGGLDLEDDVLERLDVVLVAIHTRLDLDRARQTKRILRALRHPCTGILAHPTARLIGERDPADMAVDEVLACAAEHGVAVELNAQPSRLDLSDIHVMEARRRGVAVVLSTDAHRTAGLALMRYGVDQARRAWLTAEDVLNTRPVDDLLEALGR